MSDTLDESIGGHEFEGAIQTYTSFSFETELDQNRRQLIDGPFFTSCVARKLSFSNARMRCFGVSG